MYARRAVEIFLPPTSGVINTFAWPKQPARRKSAAIGITLIGFAPASILRDYAESLFVTGHVVLGCAKTPLFARPLFASSVVSADVYPCCSACR